MYCLSEPVDHSQDSGVADVRPRASWDTERIDRFGHGLEDR